MTHGARGRGEAGQAAAELALVLPLLAFLALLLLQVALVVRDQVLVAHAAREAARAAAVEDDAGAARDAALAGASGLDPDRTEVEVHPLGGDAERRPGGRIRATVTYRSPTELPLVGMLISDISLTGRAAMRVEG